MIQEDMFNLVNQNYKAAYNNSGSFRRAVNAIQQGVDVLEILYQLSKAVDGLENKLVESLKYEMPNSAFDEIRARCEVARAMTKRNPRKYRGSYHSIFSEHDIPALLDEIKRLKKEYENIKECNKKNYNDLIEATGEKWGMEAHITTLKQEIKQLKAERDAAVRDMLHIHCAGRDGCEICLNNDVCKRQNVHTGKCADFDWRGIN